MWKRIFVLFVLVSVGLSITVEYQLHRGWQLLGVPSDSLTGRISDYLPIIEPVFFFNTETGGYDEFLEFPTGLTTGFWALCDRETTAVLEIPASSRLDTFDIEIVAGWNLICPPGLVPDDSIEQVIPSTIQADVYLNSTRAYEIAETFPLLSEGFWLLSDRDTTVRIGAYPHDVEPPDTGREFAIGITARVYDDWDSYPYGTLEDISEGYYYWPHYFEPTGYSANFFNYAESTGYYTEINFGRLVHIDLDPVPEIPNSVTGVVFAVQVYVADHYAGETRVRLYDHSIPVDSTFTDTLGRFMFSDIPAGEYTLILDYVPDPWDSTIFSFEFTVTSAETTSYFDLYFDDPYAVDAPNIYLYPETTSVVDVVVEFDNGFIVESEPPYGDGWSVTVDPDGWIDDGEYGFLYYDYLASEHWQTDSAWVLNGRDLRAEIDGMLSSYGVTGREITDFLDYWLPRIPDGDYVSFYPQPHDLMSDLTITPTPETALRLLFLIRSTDRRPLAAEPSTPVSFVREGFSIVEWGGILVE